MQFIFVEYKGSLGKEPYDSRSFLVKSQVLIVAEWI